MKTKLLTVNAVLAAVYATLTVCLAPLSYGAVQFRFAELLIFLSLYDRRLCPGLLLGCAVANCFSPTRVFDIPFGAAATGLTVYFLPMLLNARFFALGSLPRHLLFALGGSLINGLFIGLELALACHAAFLPVAFLVFAGELAVLLAGAFIFSAPGLQRVIRRLTEGI